jgi:hypothetical protein
MSKSSSQRQQTQRNDVFSLLPYAYHEAGHAVVGHVIGRLIALVSIKHATSYRGCCRFDSYAESTHQQDRWQKGRHNPELLTILYAGTIAVSQLCEQRGWDYEVLRTSNLQDVTETEQLSREMFEDDAQPTMALDGCRKQASNLLTTHWNAVKMLAGALLALQWVTGAEAHTIIGEALGEEQGDWRWDVLQTDPINQRRTAFAAERKQLIADFLKGIITEQELDEGMARIQQERLKILQSTPAWHFFGSLFDMSL